MTIQNNPAKPDDIVIVTSDADLRELAILRLRKRRDFRSHLAAYVVVNAMLWGIWYVTSLSSDAWTFPWPVFVTLGWGVGLVLNYWDVYLRHDITEGDVESEIERLRTRR